MRSRHLAILALGLASASGASARTVIIFVEPMTLERHAEVVDTPGPDRYLMCMQPPSLSGCRKLSVAKR